MSAQQIIAELSHLDRSELEQVDAQLHALLATRPGSVQRSWGEALLEVAGTAAGLPNDLARNHDHYLHGVPRK